MLDDFAILMVIVNVTNLYLDHKQFFLI